MPRRQLAARRTACEVALVLALLGCSNPGLRVTSPLPALPPTGPYLHVAGVMDARKFTTASNLAPAPSVHGDPNDPALTERVVGRRPTSGGGLGPNVLLEAPQTVESLVGRAVLAGLRGGGYRALAERPPITGPSVDLHVTVEEFWIHARPDPQAGTLAYRARIILSGSLVPLHGGRVVDVNGSVSSGGEDDVRWRRAVERCLEAISEHVERSLPEPMRR